jgi:hypothetical protein
MLIINLKKLTHVQKFKYNGNLKLSKMLPIKSNHETSHDPPTTPSSFDQKEQENHHNNSIIINLNCSTSDS